MRIWSIHPRYLDARGLVALWREALLAQKVLMGRTRGYRAHPQLRRFRSCPDAVGAIAAYLRSVAEEADLRGYDFNESKIAPRDFDGKLPVTSGQLQYEFGHLLAKLERRNSALHAQLVKNRTIETHPLFFEIDGAVQAWEVIPAHVSPRK